MGSFKKLQIKQLSKSGELLSCVNCFAGQVSVFRATSESALRPYQRALSGIPGAEKFSISVDGQHYRPEDHNLIGFGETATDASATVSDFLQAQGVPRSAVSPLLMSYGLEKFAEAKAHTLPPCEQRRLQILGSTYANDRILIINNPFDPISSQWRERFAELIVSYARTKQQIVVITSLTYRPESWIDNEFIARIQVGDTIQKTIGFGTAAAEGNDLVAQLRQRMKEEEEQAAAASHVPPSRQSEAAPPPRQSGQSAPVMPRKLVETSAAAHEGEEDSDPGEMPSYPPPPRAGRSRRAAIGGIALVAAVLVTKQFFGKEQVTQVATLPKPPAIAATAVPANPGNPPPANPAQQAVKPVLVRPSPPAANPPPAPPDPASAHFVLDMYSASVRASLVSTFEGNVSPPAAAIEKRDAPAPAGAVKAVAKAGQDEASGNLLTLLESASNTFKGPDAPNPNGVPNPMLNPNMGFPPPAPPIIDATNMDEQQKRELIRQKFLEAIKRAAEARQAAMVPPS